MFRVLALHEGEAEGLGQAGRSKVGTFVLWIDQKRQNISASERKPVQLVHAATGRSNSDVISDSLRSAKTKELIFTANRKERSEELAEKTLNRL